MTATTRPRHHADETADGLFQAVVEHPFDTLTRLVLADRLDEIATRETCPTCNGWGTAERPTPGPLPRIEERVDPATGRTVRVAKLPAVSTRDLLRLPPPCPTCGGAGTVPDGNAERAEIIRVQVELTEWEAGGRADCSWGGTCDCLGHRLTRLEAGLFTTGVDTWFSHPGMAFTVNQEWFDDPNLFGDGPNTWGLVRNGFVEEVRCPLDWWVGGECGRCQGTGYDRRDLRLGSDCPDCPGTGRTPGHGTEVVARHPVTKVAATDAVPYRANDGTWYWMRGRVDGDLNENGLPADVFDRLDGATEIRSEPEYLFSAKYYPTREAAVEALSRALVDIAREKAGLPPINWEVSQ